MRHLLTVPLLLCSLVLGACEPPQPPTSLPTPDAGPDPADLVPALLDVELASDGQSATVGSALPAPLAVRVVNRNNQPLAGVEVRWTLTEGSGELSASTSATDAQGQARVALQLGTAAGVRRVRAEVAGLPALSLSARGLPGPVARVEVTSPEPSVEVERTLRLAVALADAYGNPITGAPVTWASSDESTAVVGTDGTVRGLKTGTVRVSATAAAATATQEGVSGHVDLEVVWPTGATVFTSLAAAGNLHACATLLTGTAYCWGADSNGALGNGADTTVKRTPSPVSMPQGGTFSHVTAGADSACSLTPEGAAWCWGRNNSGQLGDGTTTTREEPVPVQLPEGVGLASLTLSRTHACGLTAEGAGWCWGRNASGELGDGTTETPRTTPVAVQAPEGVTAWSSLSPGSAFTCGVSSDGEVYCWGVNSHGQLGDGTQNARALPGKVNTPEGVLFATVHSANDYACATSREGALYCWGRNHTGQLGDGTTTTPRTTPVQVLAPEGEAFTGSRGDVERTCALTTGGELYCWGSNPAGQLGNGTTTASALPTRVLLPAGVRAATFSAGPKVTCAATTAGEAFCWGENLNGLLGNDSQVASSTTPVKVTAPPAPAP